MRRVFRYQVVVGDRPTTITLTSDPRHVEAERLGVGPQAPHLVAFWAEYEDDAGSGLKRTFQVYGTGHPIPDGARYWGTTARTPEGLVWHLYELGRGVAE